MKKLVVLGGGISGYGSAILARRKGFDVFLSDSGRIADRYRMKLEAWGVPYEEGGHSEERILAASECVKSPGIPDSAPIVRKLRERGVPVISEIEFAGRYLDGARTICITGGAMAVMAMLSLACGVLSGKYGARASSGFAHNLRQSMFRNIQTFSFSNIDKYSTAGLITRLTTDVTNLQNAYQMILRMCTRAPASLICAMVMAFLINAKLASIYLVAVIFLGGCLIFIMQKATVYFQAVFRKYDDLNASVQENIGAVRVVKAYVREGYEISKFQKACNKVYEMFLSAEKIVVMNMPLMQFTVYACILGISWLGAKMIVGSSLTTGELMSLLTYCMNILMSLMMLSMVFVMVTMSIASAERVTEVINDTADITDPEDPVTDVPDGSIVFDHVNFSYKKDSQEPVLKDINISIRSGETIGIIGGTGSAKSSLVNLISRLYDVTDGSVSVGGIDVRKYHLESLRNQVSVVLQKNVLFSGTILENLRWGDKNATEEECRRACQLLPNQEYS